MSDFVPFPKIARLSREMVVTEKIDGTNAQVLIEAPGGDTPGQHLLATSPEGLRMFAGSRNRWITPAADNYGFARWVQEHATELFTLGVGRHFGEWWGAGIQRGYGVPDKRWSLFNVSRWCLAGEQPKLISAPGAPEKWQGVLPACVGLVPVLHTGPFSTLEVECTLARLRQEGSVAAPGFMRPEGVVVYHTAAGVCFKKTIEKDEVPKGATSE